MCPIFFFAASLSLPWFSNTSPPPPPAPAPAHKLSTGAASSAIDATYKLAIEEAIAFSPSAFNRTLKLGAHQNPLTDKFTSHHYETMYGLFLYPLREARLKLFEIGLGCKHALTDARSARFWRRFLPNADLWVAELSEACVEYAKKKGLLDGIHVVTGSQGNYSTLRSWIATSGGQFDVVVDDGSHFNSHIMMSFSALWPEVVPGGFYFIEDMEVGMRKPFEDTGGSGLMLQVIQAWQEQLVYQPKRVNKTLACRHPLPYDLAFVFCQNDACMLGKAKDQAARHDQGQVWRGRRSMTKKQCEALGIEEWAMSEKHTAIAGS